MHSCAVSSRVPTLPLTMSPRDGRGFNCFFPMPYAHSARIEVTNEGDRRMVLYFYVDYEEYDRPADNVGLFHVQWRRESPTDGWGPTGATHTAGANQSTPFPDERINP